MNTQLLERKDTSTYRQPRPIVASHGKGSASKCALCGYYEMHRGLAGHCHLLNVSVQGRWKACSFALPPFAPTWEIPES